ncbi:hypothetical protein LZ31DRAFT_205081 [Colletotrichum somersetense]|nr:hypothetical protein LZ31DRAFT_205081 [Colletotrichum somersetense]
MQATVSCPNSPLHGGNVWEGTVTVSLNWIVTQITPVPAQGDEKVGSSLVLVLLTFALSQGPPFSSPSPSPRVPLQHPPEAWAKRQAREERGKRGHDASLQSSPFRVHGNCTIPPQGHDGRHGLMSEKALTHKNGVGIRTCAAPLLSVRLADRSDFEVDGVVRGRRFTRGGRDRPICTPAGTFFSAAWSTLPYLE